MREVLSDQTWVGPGNFARGGDAFVDYVAEHLSVDRTAYIDNAGDDMNIGDDTTEGDDVVLGDDDKPSADDETHGVHRQLDASGGSSVWDDNYPFEWAARTPKVLGMTYYATWEKEYTMSSFYRDAAWLSDLRGIVRGVVDDAADNDENSADDLPALHFMEVRARPSAMRRHGETVGIRHTASRRASTRWRVVVIAPRRVGACQDHECHHDPPPRVTVARAARRATLGRAVRLHDQPGGAHQP